MLIRHKWSGCFDDELLSHIEPPDSSDRFTDDTDAEVLGVRLCSTYTNGLESSEPTLQMSAKSSPRIIT